MKNVFRLIGIIALAAVIGFSFIACDELLNALNDDEDNNDDNTFNTSPDVGTGSQESRRYRVEVYNINSATYDYLSDTYGEKTYQDVIRASVISRGHTTPMNTYTDQAFSDVTSRWTSTVSSIGGSSTWSTWGIDRLTVTLQTNNRGGHTMWVWKGSNFRFFYVNRTSPDNYTVEVYNINSATSDYLSNTYGGKTYQDVVRADVISRGHTTPMNTYTDQTFSDVTSRWTSTVSSIGGSSTRNTWGIERLTAALQTNNRSGSTMWVWQGSNYRFFYVSQE